MSTSSSKSSSPKDLAKKVKNLTISTTLKNVAPRPRANSKSGSPKTPVFQQTRRRLSVATGGPADPSKSGLDGFAPDAPKEVKKQQQAEKGSVAKSRAAFVSFASLSKVGFVPFNNAKVNQDRAMVNIKFDGSEAKALFSVYDGHGVKGHEVSNYVARELPKHLLAQPSLDSKPLEALQKAFVQCNDSLRQSAIDCNFSGTTAIVCYLNGTRLYSANAGDSRAVLAQDSGDGKSLIAVPLSSDHKPDRADECKRILDAKGRVYACKSMDGKDLGPPRVWLAKQDVPGLAMTRSMGDIVASTVGVTSVPEVWERDLTPGDRFMILATDGVWEFIPSQEAVNLVAGCQSPEDACQLLVKEATLRWKQQEEVIDDITCIVVFFSVSGK